MLPDNEAWSNKYVILKYPERPTYDFYIFRESSWSDKQLTLQNAQVHASSPRLSKAVLQPLQMDDGYVMQYLLPEENGPDILEESYQHPMRADLYPKLVAIASEDAQDPRMGEIFPVSRLRASRY